MKIFYMLLIKGRCSFQTSVSRFEPLINIQITNMPWTAYLGDYTIKCMFRGLYDHWLALPSGRQCISLPYS